MVEQYSALLLDLDDTLFDHGGSATAAISTVLRERYSVAEHQLPFYRIVWRVLEELHFDRYAAGRISFCQQREFRAWDTLFLIENNLAADFLAQEPAESLTPARVAEYLKGFNIQQQPAPLNSEGLNTWFDDYLEVYRASWKLFEEVPEFLSRLGSKYPELKLAIVTNGEPKQQIEKLWKLGLDWIPATISGAVGVSKPESAIFSLALEPLAVTPAEALYIGDNPRVDFFGALSAGLDARWLNRPGSFHQGALPGFSSEQQEQLQQHQIPDLAALLGDVDSHQTSKEIGSPVS